MATIKNDPRDEAVRALVAKLGAPFNLATEIVRDLVDDQVDSINTLSRLPQGAASALDSYLMNLLTPASTPTRSVSEGESENDSEYVPASEAAVDVTVPTVDVAAPAVQQMKRRRR